MKKIIILSAVIEMLIIINCQGQTIESKIFKRDFRSIDFYQMIFLERELIEFCSDTNDRKKFFSAFKNRIKLFNTLKPDAVKESKILFSLLKENIKSITLKDNKLIESKTFILKQLNEIKIDFPVDEKLLESRFNPNKRGLPFGDEDCAEGVSYYVFFLYDPNLYLKVLKNNKIANPSGKIFFPNRCILEENNQLDLKLKSKIKEGILGFEKPYLSKDSDFKIIYNQIYNANLNAEFH